MNAIADHRRMETRRMETLAKFDLAISNLVSVADECVRENKLYDAEDLYKIAAETWVVKSFAVDNGEDKANCYLNAGINSAFGGDAGHARAYFRMAIKLYKSVQQGKDEHMRQKLQHEIDYCTALLTNGQKLRGLEDPRQVAKALNIMRY